MQTAMRTKKVVDYTSKPFFKKIVLFTVPLMLGNILQLLYNAVDTIILGRFGSPNSAGAVGMTGSIIGLFTNVLMGLATGVSVLFGKYVGEKNDEKAQKVVHTAVAAGLTFGFLIGIIGFLFSGVILKIMQTPDEFFYNAQTYLRVVFLGLPALFLYNFSSAVLLGGGDSKRPFVFSAISGMVNVGGNLLFVIAFKMDTLGVALSTVISQYLMAFMVIVCLLTRKNSAKLYFKKIRFDKTELKGMFRIGLPNGIQSAFFSLADMIVQTGINKSITENVAGFTTDVQNGNSFAGNVSGFIYAAMRSVYTATVTFTSQNLGAKRNDNIKSVLKNCLSIVFIYSVTLGALAAIFAESILTIYTNDANIIREGAYRMRVVLPFHFILGMMDVFIGFFHGLGKSTIPMVVSVLCCCILRVVYIYTIFAWFTSTTILYVMYPITHGITLIVLMVYYFAKEKKNLSSNIVENDEIQKNVA